MLPLELNKKIKTKEKNSTMAPLQEEAETVALKMTVTLKRRKNKKK